MIIPPNISSNEPLLRAFSLPSGLDGEKRATPLIFRLHSNEKDISLTRLLYDNLMDFLKKSSSFIFKFLSPNDEPAGAVELIAGEVASLSQNILVKATPSKNNPAHASIYYLLSNGKCYKQPKRTTVPTDPTILGYEMALAAVVHKIYDLRGNVIWMSK